MPGAQGGAGRFRRRRRKITPTGGRASDGPRVSAGEARAPAARDVSARRRVALTHQASRHASHAAGRDTPTNALPPLGWLSPPPAMRTSTSDQGEISPHNALHASTINDLTHRFGPIYSTRHLVCFLIGQPKLRWPSRMPQVKRSPGIAGLSTSPCTRQPGLAPPPGRGLADAREFARGWLRTKRRRAHGAKSARAAHRGNVSITRNRYGTGGAKRGTRLERTARDSIKHFNPPMSRAARPR